MNKRSLTLGFTFVLAAVLFAGCPNIPNVGGTNSVTLHNNHTTDITQFSVTRVEPTETPNTKEGINLLPTPLKPGESFTVPDLADGTYELTVQYLRPTVSNPTEQARQTVTQLFEGGKDYDWYFRVQ
jgi:hypothetical protein